jgi:hypothetical protein
MILNLDCLIKVMPALRWVTFSFPYAVWVRQESLSPVHTQREGSKIQLLDRGISKNLWTYVETTK